MSCTASNASSASSSIAFDAPFVLTLSHSSGVVIPLPLLSLSRRFFATCEKDEADDILSLETYEDISLKRLINSEVPKNLELADTLLSKVSILYVSMAYQRSF